MTDNTEWMASAQEYLRRVGEAEYKAFANRKKPLKRDRFAPSAYLSGMCQLIGKGDEEAFKATKLVQGRYSALGL
jgi:hypothetical protein